MSARVLNVINGKVRWIFQVLFIALAACSQQAGELSRPAEYASFPIPTLTGGKNNSEAFTTYHRIRRDVTIGHYFEFLDTLVRHYDSLLNYPINEHLIVRANPWLLDSLIATDYYQLIARNIFVYDPQSMVILHQGDSLKIPDGKQVDELLEKLSQTIIDINIPEFKLRIREGEKVLYAFPVRVGRNERKYLAMAGQVVDLRTRTGTGEVIRINQNPVFINPSNNKRYFVTRRDDGKLTKLPRIPWIELALDKQRYGQLIHPTTNPETLERAYSNGCIGTRESDAWVIYYYAPVGTKAIIRYTLTVVDEKGDTTLLKDIYPGNRREFGT